MDQARSEGANEEKNPSGKLSTNPDRKIMVTVL
jgi:hypothetical protein